MRDGGDENPCSETGFDSAGSRSSLEKPSPSCRDGEDGEGPCAVTPLYAAG